MSTKLCNPRLLELAESYMYESFGLAYVPTFTDITLEQAARIADSFLAGEQYTPQALHAYRLFKAELMLQWEYVIASGLVIEPYTGTGEPYANSRALFDDVNNNNHMYFFLTTNGFGSDASAASERHPMLEKSGVILAETELLYNDIFRIVHDFFGHCIYGFQFGLKGETNAWQSHLAMFVTQQARQALTNETQGQTSFFQAGPHLRRPDGSLPSKGESDYIPLEKRPFAEQRVQILDAAVFAGLAVI